MSVPGSTQWRMVAAWLQYAVTEYCLEYRHYTSDQRQKMTVPVLSAYESEIGVDGFADLTTGCRLSEHANEAADMLARGIALLALHNRDLARAEGAAEHMADVDLFGMTFNADRLIRERCDRLAAEDEREADLRAAGYIEPDWDDLADAYVDGSDEWVAAAIRHGYCNGPLWGCQITDLFVADLFEQTPVADLREAA